MSACCQRQKEMKGTQRQAILQGYIPPALIRTEELTWKHGVAMELVTRFPQGLESYSYVNNRIISVRLKSRGVIKRHCNYRYAPKDGRKEETKKNV